MKRFKQILFLLLILFSSTSFIKLKVFAFLPFNIINLVLSIYFIIYSFVKDKSLNTRYFQLTTSFIKFFFLANVLAAITAYFDWNQNFFISIIASRTVWWIFFGYYLMKSKTNLGELHLAFSVFTWVFLFFTLIVAILPDSKATLLFVDEDNVYKIDELFFEGFPYLLIPFYFNLDKLVSNVKLTNLELIQFLLTIFAAITIGNRSNLFPLLFILVFSIVFNFNVNIIRNTIFTLFLTGFSFVFIVDVVDDLIKETTEQLSDDQYPRTRGIIYFSNSFSKSFLGYCFGNSVGSRKVSYGESLDDLKKIDGLYISDLGIFGTWVQFGILSILSIFIPIFKILSSGTYHKSFKFLSLHMIMGWAVFLFLPEVTFVFFISMLYMFELKLTQQIRVGYV